MQLGRLGIHASMSESLKRKMKKVIVRSPIELCQFKLQKCIFCTIARPEIRPIMFLVIIRLNIAITIHCPERRKIASNQRK